MSKKMGVLTKNDSFYIIISRKYILGGKQMMKPKKYLYNAKSYEKIMGIRGITLIALIITILVLLILAGVSIAMLTGENGILNKANQAKLSTEIADEKEAIMLAYNGVMIRNKGDGVTSSELKEELTYNGRNDVESVFNGNNNDIIIQFNSGRNYAINEKGNIEQILDDNIEIAKIKSLWLGDSAMRGYGNNNKGFPEYFAEFTGAECLNYSYTGATITDNTGEAWNTQEPVTLKRQIELIQNKADSIDLNQIDFIILDGGGNDLIGYINGTIDTRYQKDIGTVQDKTSDTVLNDFREVIDILKEDLPNAKIIYILPVATDRTALELMAFKAFFGNKTLEQINEMTGHNFSTMQQAREKVYELNLYGLDSAVEEIFLRSQQLFNGIKMICNECNIEFLDFSNNFIENRSTDGSDTNSYLQNDMVHLTDEAYVDLTHSIKNVLERLIG